MAIRRKDNKVQYSHQPNSLDLSGISIPKPPVILGPDGQPLIEQAADMVLAFQPEEGFDPAKPVALHGETKEIKK